MSAYFEVVTSRASDEWFTPQWLVDQLAAEFGPVRPRPRGYGRHRQGKRPWFPARSDAKTCSAACRQALKRSQVTRRKRDRKRRRKAAP